MNTVTYLKILNFKAIFQSKYLLICYLILSVSITENYAQQKNSKSTVYSAEQASKMIAEADQITMKEGNNMPSNVRLKKDIKITKGQFIPWLKKSLKTKPGVDFAITKSQIDKQGIEHVTLQQSIDGIPVKNAIYLVHIKDNRVTSFNGFAVVADNVPARSDIITATEALKLGLETQDVSKLKSEVPYWEKEIKEHKNDPKATYAPKGELMWWINNDGKRIKIYQFDIYSASPDRAFRMLVNASSGVVENVVPLESNCTPATTNTIFNGVKNISTDKYTANDYRMRDDCDAAVIYVRDWGSADCTSAPFEITNTDNVWDTQSEIFAGSVMWYTKQAYKLWKNVYLRDSYDDADGAVNGYINAIFDGNSSMAGCQPSSNNASMSFTGGTMKVGSGGGGPLTNSYATLDIIGHEYAHAVTGSTAELEYQNESGALNESFSDIFGEALELYSNGTNDWLMGAERDGGYIRNLSNPKDKGQPDTYLGTNWYNGANDFGGVHTNSGVQNFWFYLMAVGGTGTNDNGDDYDVPAIGFNQAAVIAYNCLLSYLGPTSDYADARDASIAAVTDIWGVCSPEMKAVMNAWHAVGVGDAFPKAGISVGDPTVCVGKPINLFATGGTSYAWTGPAAFVSTDQNPVRNNAQAGYSGYYQVTVTFSNGCEETVGIDVIVNPLPVAQIFANPNPICTGSDLILNALGGISYEWSGPAGFASNIKSPSVNDIQLNQAGIYTVTVTSGDGCLSNTNVNVVVNQTPVATALASPNPICSGNALTLNSSGGGTYAWSGPGGFASNLKSPIINNIQASQSGVYTVTVTSAQGCADNANVNVTVNQTPVPTALANPNPVCVGSVLILSSTGGATYQWSGPNGFTSGKQNPAFLVNSENQEGLYTVTVTSAEGCPAATNVNVTVNPLPVGVISVSTLKPCVGSVVQFFASGGVSYQWSGPKGFSSTQQNPSLLINAFNQGGKYSVIITNQFGCSVTKTVAIQVYFPPVATASHDLSTACIGNNLSLTSGGNGSKAWSGPNGFLSNLTNPVINNVTVLNSGIYTVTVTSPNGCTDVASTNVNIVAPPAVTANASDLTVCEGSAVQLLSSGGKTYKWTGPYGYTTTLQNPWIENIPSYMSGIFNVTATGATGCKATAGVNIAVYNQILGSANASPNPISTGQQLQLSSTGGSSYQWTGPNGFFSTEQNPVIYNAGSKNVGTYVVLVYNEGGCEYAYFVNVSIKNSSIVIDTDSNIKATSKKSNLYPNPSREFIMLDHKLNAQVRYRIIDASGLVVQSSTIAPGEQINVQELSNGFFTIIWSEDKDQAEQFINKFIKID